MKYKGEGPPRMHHIKKTGILKKPLVELVEDEAEYERAERERDAAAAKQKSDFKLNFDQMYGNQAAAGGKGANGKASSKPALPSVASLLADRQQAQQKHEQPPTLPPQPQRSSASESKMAAAAAPSVPISAPATHKSAAAAAPKPASATSASAALVESEWTQASVRCQLQCPSLSLSRANASGLIPFDSTEWDSDVLPESLVLSIHMPSLVRLDSCLSRSKCYVSEFLSISLIHPVSIFNHFSHIRSGSPTSTLTFRATMFSFSAPSRALTRRSPLISRGCACRFRLRSTMAQARPSLTSGRRCCSSACRWWAH